LTSTHVHVGDLQLLLAGVWLGHQELVDVDTELAGVRRIEGMLGVDERGDATTALGLGDDVQADGRLARALRPEHLDDPAARDATDAQRDVERDGPGRDDRDPGPHRMLAELHDCALAELLLDLLEGDVQHLLAIHARSLLLTSPPPVEGRSGALLFGATNRSREVRHNLHPCHSKMNRLAAYPNTRSRTRTSSPS